MKLAIEKRRRRQLAIRWTVSRCAPIRRRFIGRYRRATGSESLTLITLSNRPHGSATAARLGRVQGVSALFRDSAYLAKILGGATDGSNAGGSGREQFDVPPKHYRQIAVHQHGKMSMAARLTVFLLASAYVTAK